ncbi:MAG TPA: hypothetical protein VNK82_09090 [Terriglobales bacterium]|nr:hypothetical protein [Terriglobales bacterium]
MVKAMSGEYNHIIDNMAVRVTLIVVGFALWAVASVGLLALAV